MKLAKNFVVLAALVLALGLFSFTSLAPEAKVDPSQSTVTWKANKVTGSHEGTVNLKDGDLVVEEGVLKGGQFTMDMTSIVNTDMEGEYKGKLEGHLKSPDFFDVAVHPTANFTITRVVAKGTPGDYKVIGDLTIKGITKEIKFYTNVQEIEGGYAAKADISIDRSDFDIKYGSGSFFDNLGDKTIYDEFDLAVYLVSKK